MINQDKANAVCEYFHKEFPGHSIAEAFDAGRGVHIFRIINDDSIWLLRISKAFVDTKSIPELEDWLKNSDIVKQLSVAERVNLFVDEKGVTQVI